MLRRLGYPCTLIWGRSKDSGPLVKTWYNAGQLNFGGVLVRGREKEWWLFPFLRCSSVDTYPWQVAGAGVLLEHPTENDPLSDAPLFRDAPPATAAAVLTVTGTVRPDADGCVAAIRGELTCPADGVLIDELYREGPESRASTLQPLFIAEALRGSIVRESSEMRGATASYSCSLRADPIRTATSDLTLLRVEQLGPPVPRLPSADRKSPVVMPYPVTHNSSPDHPHSGWIRSRLRYRYTLRSAPGSAA